MVHQQHSFVGKTWFVHDHQFSVLIMKQEIFQCKTFVVSENSKSSPLNVLYTVVVHTILKAVVCKNYL